MTYYSRHYEVVAITVQGGNNINECSPQEFTKGVFSKVLGGHTRFLPQNEHCMIAVNTMDWLALRPMHECLKICGPITSNAPLPSV